MCVIKDSEMRLSWIISSSIIVRSDIITRVFIRGKQIRGERRQCKSENRNLSAVATSQGMPAVCTSRKG